MPAILGLGEQEYRKNCLSGFGRAEECGVAVGAHVLRVLRAEGARGAEGLVRWLAHELDVARRERDGEGEGEAEGEEEEGGDPRRQALPRPKWKGRLRALAYASH